MSLDATRLANAMKAGLPATIKASFDASYPLDPDLDDDFKALANADREKFADTLSTGIADVLAQTIIDELTNNADVTVASVSGVTSGVDTSGPGSGTIS